MQQDMEPIDWGNQGENFLEWLCNHSFVTDFVFRSHKYKKGSLERELCDVLVWFKDILVIFQIKTADRESYFSKSQDKKISWAKKKYKKGIKQAKGACSTIMSGKISTLNNARRGDISFDPEEIKRCFSIVVVDHIGVSNVFQNSSELAAASCPTYCISLENLYYMLQELDTMPDFIDFLSARMQAEGNGHIESKDELNFLAEYKLNPPAMKKAIENPRGVTLTLGENIWNKYQNWEAKKKRDEENKFSRIIDGMIEVAHTSHEDTDIPDEVIERHSGRVMTMNEGYIYPAMFLSSYNRLERRSLGRMCYEKVLIACEEKRDSSFMKPSEEDSKCFIFLCTSKTEQDRIIELDYLVTKAKIATGADEVLAVATEASPPGSGKRSHSFVFDATPGERFREAIPDKVYKSIKEELEKKKRIVIEDEFPGIPAATRNQNSNRPSPPNTEQSDVGGVEERTEMNSAPLISRRRHYFYVLVFSVAAWLFIALAIGGFMPVKYIYTGKCKCGWHVGIVNISFMIYGTIGILTGLIFSYPIHRLLRVAYSKRDDKHVHQSILARWGKRIVGCQGIVVLIIMVGLYILGDFVSHKYYISPLSKIMDGKCYTELHCAISRKDIGGVQNALYKGIDVNATDGFGQTPLLYAAWYGDMDIAKVLVINGANINATRAITGISVSGEYFYLPSFSLYLGRRESVLDIAEFRGNEGIVKFLRSKGAKTSAELKEGK